MSNSTTCPVTIQAIDLGVKPYQEVWDLQKSLHAKVVNQNELAYMLLLQHESVLTLGKHAAKENLLLSETDYKSQNIALQAIDRGGEVTAHNPGQMVVYPILSIRQFELTPKKYIAVLEQCVIETLRQFDLCGVVEEGLPGVWVEGKKICAVGVRIKDRVTMHGLALNVTNDLEIFNKIVPCGIKNRTITSIAELRPCINLESVQAEFVKSWRSLVGSVDFIKNISKLIGT